MGYGRESKLRSWDYFGSRYWELAAHTSHPSPFEIGQFLAGVTQASRVLVIGATTRGVIVEALSREALVTVMDFAPKLIEKLKSTTPSERLNVVLGDISEDTPAELRSRFDVVLSDRLVNRFHRSEMPRVCASMGSLATPGGSVRIAARLGLYPLDHALISEGQKHGTVRNFWDEATRTIDWSRVGSELDTCATAHGEIPRDVVIAWSRLRGIESRISDDDVRGLIGSCIVDGMPLTLESVVDLDVAPNTKLYVARRAQLSAC